MKTRYTSSLLFAAALSLSAFVPLSAEYQGLQPISQPKPVYLYDLLWNRLEAEVVVDFTVTPTGEVANPVVVRTSQQSFNYPTLAAIKQWKFIPAMKDGVAVSTAVRQVVQFSIRSDDPEPATKMVAGKPTPGPSVRKSASAK